MVTSTSTSPASERGSMSLELAVIAPALLVLIGLIVGAGRVALGEQAVQQAAAQAARDVTLSRTPEAGAAAGRDTAERVLAGQGLHCTSSSTSVSAAALGYPPGTPGTVTVSVTCRVELSDLMVPGLPGGKTLQAEVSMPTNPYVSSGS